jgi:Ca2+-binding EF-hand superfamily protein
MKRFDTNGDGRITRDEMQANPFLFERMDENKDGVVTANELGLLERRKQPSAMPGRSQTLNQEP